MSFTEISALSALAALPQASVQPRAVDAAKSNQFRELMATQDCTQAGAACDAPSPQRLTMSMDIEKVLMDNLPAPSASPAEFAMGMLRAQVKVSQAAIAIEMVSKTTQSLSQGVQSLTTRS